MHLTLCGNAVNVFSIMIIILTSVCKLCYKHFFVLQNQSPQVRHADLILNLMRCIGASATAEDDKEEENQNSPAMLKKQRRYLLDPSGEDDKDVQAQISIDKPAASGDNAAAQKKENAEAEMDWPTDAELFGVAEIAEMAILLLQMILELCGRSLRTLTSMEDAYAWF